MKKIICLLNLFTSLIVSAEWKLLKSHEESWNMYINSDSSVLHYHNNTGFFKLFGNGIDIDDKNIIIEENGTFQFEMIFDNGKIMSQPIKSTGRVIYEKDGVGVTVLLGIHISKGLYAKNVTVMIPEKYGSGKAIFRFTDIDQLIDVISKYQVIK